MYSYDRRKSADAAPRFEAVLYKAAEADDLITKAYLSLHSFKAGMDRMEEIPKQLHPVYKELMAALDALDHAKKPSYQLRMMVQRLPR